MSNARCSEEILARRSFALPENSPRIMKLTAPTHYDGVPTATSQLCGLDFQVFSGLFIGLVTVQDQEDIC